MKIEERVLLIEAMKQAIKTLELALLLTEKKNEEPWTMEETLRREA